MRQIPVKFRVVQLIFLNEQVSNLEITEMLKKEYPFDRSINEKGINNYLLTLKTVGLIELTNAFLDNLGKLKQCYRITDYGTSRMKYIA